MSIEINGVRVWSRAGQEGRAYFASRLTTKGEGETTDGFNEYVGTTYDQYVPIRVSKEVFLETLFKWVNCDRIPWYDREIETRRLQEVLLLVVKGSAIPTRLLAIDVSEKRDALNELLSLVDKQGPGSRAVYESMVEHVRYEIERLDNDVSADDRYMREEDAQIKNRIAETSLEEESNEVAQAPVIKRSKRSKLTLDPLPPLSLPE